MAWFKISKAPKLKVENKKVQMPAGLWLKCNGCGEIIYKKEIEKNLNVCPKCNYHFRISAKKRMEMIMDEGSFSLFASELEPVDPLKFRDSKKYTDRVKEAQKKTKRKDAIDLVEGNINGTPAIAAIFEFGFMGGSMGSVVGEKITMAIEKGLAKNKGVIVFSSSGGARMQEGIYSLMQMAKTSAALAKLKNAGIPFISVLTDPTYGGVTASFAMLGDIIIAEPKSMIGFAGPRVIEQTIRQPLPEGFQKAEYLLEHGMVDMIVERKALKETLSRLLSMLKK
ncbi:MAG: acetyl-CoA carboxylase, carboxyltransferase subunit beta [Deltaproteobacteria bacterium]|nr:acetyl-CoA carboxylase, carboxyltransferase subunit beta [Deltaproteobacteria bacterium]